MTAGRSAICRRGDTSTCGRTASSCRFAWKTIASANRLIVRSQPPFDGMQMPVWEIAFGARTAQPGSGGHGRARATARHHSDSSRSSRGSRSSWATRKSSAASSRRLMALTCFSRSVSSDISILLSCLIAGLSGQPHLASAAARDGPSAGSAADALSGFQSPVPPCKSLRR